MPLAQEKVLRRGIEEKFAVAVEDSLLSVAWMVTESFELETGFEVSQKMNVATLDVDPIGLQGLCEPRQAINSRCGEDDAIVQKLLQQVIENFRGFLPRTESASEKSCMYVPHQMFTELLPSN